MRCSVLVTVFVAFLLVSLFTSSAEALEKPCKYCKYCEFCAECQKCPCEESPETPNCRFCGYCKYCTFCKLCSVCAEGGLVDSISSFWTSISGYAADLLGGPTSTKELEDINQSALDAELKNVKLNDEYRKKFAKDEL